jgi:hypothetical protein
MPVKTSLNENPADADELLVQLNEIYDLYRSAALNKAYYGRMLSIYQRRNLVIEIILAVTASGSGISGLVWWQTDYGRPIWAVLSLLAGILAVAKPILQFNVSVERYSKLFTGHLDNYLSLRTLVSRIKKQRRLTGEMIRQFEQAEKRYIELSRGDDPQTVLRVHQQCEQEIRGSIPDSALWWPEPQKQRKSKSKKSPLKISPTANQAINISEFPTAVRTNET